MKKALTLLISVLSITGLYAQTPAFPGAEGGGMYTTGGRGGDVYYVNTLVDNSTGNSTTKEGSLRWCLNQTGKRTILFKVSGTIMLQSALKIKNGDVTIAGQSAPGDGICIGNNYVDVGANNVIIRYLRFRMGDDGVAPGGADALGGRFFKNVIIDHCSMAWSTDECVSFYNCDYFTLQWSIIAESLRLSNHDKGPHGYGGIWGGTNSSFHHNLMAHNDSRTPRFGPGQNTTPHTETTDHRNNVIYNYGNTYGGEGMCLNIINNFYKPGAKNSTGAARGRIMSADKDKNVGSIRYNVWPQMYVDGNVVDDGKNEANCTRATNDNWTYGVYNQFASGYGTVSAEDKAAMKMENQFIIKGLSGSDEIVSTVTTHLARTAYDKVLEYSGASLRRDSYDERIVNETKTGTVTFKGLSKYNGYTTNYPETPDIDWRSSGYPKAGIIDSHWDTKPAGAADDWTPWPVLVSGEVPVDSNRDGIPDGWLESNFPEKSAKDLNENGYTYLEVYLNSLVEIITQKQNEDAIPSGMGNIDFNKDPKLYYDVQSEKLHVNASELIKSISIYDITGILICHKICNDTNLELLIPRISQRFLIAKINMENKQITTIKVVI